MNKKPKLVYGIKGKLVSAACMLLVAVIMVVSSTYAWFTLSTAPEVTGIQTAVGANGSLEMALLPTGLNADGTVKSIADILNSINSTSGDSMKNWAEKNTTWGNLVDLSEAATYGWDQLILYPSQLNEDNNKIPVDGAILKTPEYGADGRVTDLVEKTALGVYDYNGAKNFPVGNGYGVRAVGVSSGLTDRQLAYRNARAAANTARQTARNQASQSLHDNGGSLANVAIALATAENKETVSISRADVEKLQTIVNDLAGEGGVLEQIETAYKQYILAYAASQAGGEADVLWQAVNGAMNMSLEDLLVHNFNGVSLTLPEGLKTATDALAVTRDNVEAAGATLTTLLAETGDTFTWTQVQPAMSKLVNVDEMTVNDMTTDTIKQEGNMDKLVSDVAGGKGINVGVPTGAGVYADVADHCGNYKTSVDIDKVSYGGISVGPITANMETKCATTSILETIGTAVEAAKAPESVAGAKPMSEFYGYIIDMAFRTNAANSNLLLQTAPADRIYEGNNNESTMGKGSTMTFTTDVAGFSTNQIVDLMKNIRIVFFNPTDGTILAKAKLDIRYNEVVENGKTVYKPIDSCYTLTADGGVTANIYLITEVETVTGYTAEIDGTTTTVYEKDGAYYKDQECTEENKVADGVTVTPVTIKTETLIKKQDDAKITALTQNVAQAVSVLVYLDGSNITNADVASNGMQSMSGTMNLQFASDADLSAMEYGDLHTPDKNVNTDETTQEPTT